MVLCLGCGAPNAPPVSVCQWCGAGLATVCPSCGAGNPALAKFCGGCGGAFEPGPESLAPISREKAERRQITVLFCDLVGSTQLARAMDPEDWHQLLNEVHSQFGEVVAEHHGHVAQYLGDGLLAYFGYPTAAQDDPRRAVTAGLALLRQAASLEASTHRNIRIRVGIHTGPVVVGHVGSRRQESLALGETPNLAARLQEHAPPNCVVVSAETHRLVEGFFLSEALGSLVPKGFSDPVSLYRVVEESGVTTRLEAASAAGLTPLVGREMEAKAIEHSWNLAKARQGPVMLLLGDAGIGKSRLIHELKERLAPHDVSCLELRCSEHARNSAFHRLIEGLQRLAGVRAGESTDQITSKLDRLLGPLGLSQEQIALIRSLLGVPLPSPYSVPTQSLRAALVEAFSAWISGTGESGPTLFVVEDLHWADPSTLELLSALMKRRSPGAVLTVLSARPEFQAEWTTDEHVQTLVPRRLDAQDTMRLITFVAGGEFLPKELVEQLATRADGIPLFLEEMTKAILESGLLRKTDDGYKLDGPIRNSTIPTTLHDSLMGRLDQLGPYKAIVQVASVLGKEFSLRLFESVWRRSPSPADIDVKRGLERVVAAQLISRGREFESDTVYQFKHSLVQEAAYHSLLRSARRNYHLQTAGALRDEFTAQAELQPELVAYHYAAAQMDEQAADFWFKAGQRSIGSSAYLEAISQFSAAVDHLGTLPRSAQRLRREIENRASLGVALLTTRGYAAPEVHETFSLAALLCKELGAELPFRVLYGVWGVNLVRGDLTSVQHMVPTFKRVAQEETDSLSSLAAHAALGTWAFWRGDYAGLREHCAAASRLLDASRARRSTNSCFATTGSRGCSTPTSTLHGPWGSPATWRPQSRCCGRPSHSPNTSGILMSGRRCSPSAPPCTTTSATSREPPSSPSACASSPRKKATSSGRPSPSSSTAMPREPAMSPTPGSHGSTRAWRCSGPPERRRRTPTTRPTSRRCTSRRGGTKRRSASSMPDWRWLERTLTATTRPRSCG